jgi:1,4-dihydroxy-2-naphthoate polyprenyltransferase
MFVRLYSFNNNLNIIDMANFSFWKSALITIPRITKDEWNGLDIISRWLVATRASVLIMTAFSAIIAGILAYLFASFNVLNFTVAFVGLIFAHASNNLINDLIDYKKGVDKDNYFRSLYGVQLLEHNYTSSKTFYKYVAFSLLIASLSGLFLILRTDFITTAFFVSGFVFLLFYTWPFKYIGLGEIVVLLVWGPLMIGGTYYVTTGGSWNWDVVYIALLYAIGPTTVLLGKHTDKLKEDLKKKVYTLPVILKQRNSRYFTMLLWIAQYALIGYYVFENKAWPLLITVLAFPKLFSTFKVFSQPRPTEEPKDNKTGWPLYLVSYAFIYNRLFSMLFFVGLLASVVLYKYGVLSW